VVALRRSRSRPVLAFAVLLALLAALAGVTLRSGGHERAVAEASPNDPVAPQVLTYFHDATTALTPLLTYVRALPQIITYLESDTGVVTQSVLNQASYMGDSFALARDLVGRLPVPEQAPAAVGELLQLSCQLYRQAVVAIADLHGLPHRGAQAQAVLRRVNALRDLGDRVIDQVRRVLRIDSAGAQQAHIVYRFAPPVPPVEDILGRSRPVVAAGSLRTQLAAARSLLTAVSAPGHTSSDTESAQLEAVTSQLQGRPESSSEPVVAARLALLIALVADQARQQQSSTTDVLLSLSDDLWNQAAQLSSRPHHEVMPLRGSRLPRSQVWVGGPFNGTPPPLKPGDPVDAGVPGGLPTLDPTKILKG
jgi:hypothetical protein